jgi:conjugal transfer pilus assembly protein TraF
MNHRQSITVLAAASLNLAGTAPLRASDGDGVEVRQSEDALYCKERKLGTWFYCEKPKEEPRKSAAAPPPARERLPQSAPSLRN